MTANNYQANVQRQWFTDGPSLGYKGWGRTVFWLMTLVLYALLNMYYLRIRTGELHNLGGPFEPENLIAMLRTPLDVFQFPSYILVTALIMGMLCTIPMITAQLYNFMYAVPFLFATFFLGHLPWLTLALLISCMAISIEPFRFKSKFVAGVMCYIPVFIYWIFRSGNNDEQDVLRWAVLYAPWVLAFLFGIMLFGMILIIGHIVRYRPVIILPVFGLTLAGTVYLFHTTIGMPERDFQAVVMRYSPDRIPEFQPRSITPLLTKELEANKEKTPYVSDELIANTLKFQWLEVFNSNARIDTSTLSGSGQINPVSLARKVKAKMDAARFHAMDQIDTFIRRYPNNPRVGDAMYYLALLYDLEVDLPALRDEDMLRFSYDYPSMHSEHLWAQILEQFSGEDIAIKARYRLATLLARQKPDAAHQPFHFDEAIELLEEAGERLTATLEKRLEEEKQRSFWLKRLGTIFAPPQPTLTENGLRELRYRIGDLRLLIGTENRTGHSRQNIRLADFVGMTPYQLNYAAGLKELLIESQPADPLRDNIELALLQLNKDRDDRIAGLAELIRHFPESDGAARARLRLARLLLEDSKTSEHIGDRHHLLQQSREYLQKIVSARPSTYLAIQAQQLLMDNPLQ